MQRIAKNTTSVEHYITQNHHTDSPYTELEHKEHELRYRNMLGSCNIKNRNCSGIRGNIPLTIDPRTILIENQIGYQNNGVIYAINKNETVQKDLEILKLGTKHSHQSEHWLIQNRAAVIDRVRKKLDLKGWSKSTIQAEINVWQTPDIVGYLEPNCQVAIFYLRKKLRNYL